MTAPDPARAGRALGGAAAAVLLLEGISVLFVPRGIAQSGAGLTTGRLSYLLVLAVVLILASGVQRRPWGLIAATALQVPLVLTGLLNGIMWFLGGIFVLIWLYLLQVRKQLLGTPFGRPGAPPPSQPIGAQPAPPAPEPAEDGEEPPAR